MTIYPLLIVFGLLIGLLSLDGFITAWLYYKGQKRPLAHVRMTLYLAEVFLGQEKADQILERHKREQMVKSYPLQVLVASIISLYMSIRFILSSVTP